MTRWRSRADHGTARRGQEHARATLVAQGYERLNRDEAGGTLTAICCRRSIALIAAGASRIVLDNTYVSRKSRAPVIRRRAARGLPVRCVWLLDQRRGRAGQRRRRGWSRATDGCSTPRRSARGASRTSRRSARRAVPLSARARAAGSVEGFSRIETSPFERRHDPSFVNRALIVWCDGVLHAQPIGHAHAASPDDVEVMPERGDILRRYHDEGWRVLGLSWQPEIAEGARTPADVDAVFADARAARPRDRRRLCPHAAGPPVCWCRKPLPGLGVLLDRAHGSIARSASTSAPARRTRASRGASGSVPRRERLL